ncbi:MAG: prepilin peptidase [Conexivisphaerales archaeon]
MDIFLVFLVGISIGSFLNVVIYRVPRRESILFPPSHCPYCNHKFSPLDNIPIISYIFLKGKCRYCGKPISPMYPIVELTTGIIFVLTYLKFGFPFCIYYAVAATLLLVIALIDLNTMYVYMNILIPGIFFSILVPTAISIINKSWLPLVNSLSGFILISGEILLVYLISYVFYKQEGIGQGDIFVAMLIGAVLGPALGSVAIGLSFVFGAFIELIKGSKNMKKEVPFVPYMMIGFLISLLAGDKILSFLL